MNKKDLENWKNVRKKGMWHYVFKMGVMSWGLMMFIVMAIVNKPFANGFATKQAITHCIIWPMAGVFFGLLTWYFIERSYKKSITENDSNS